MKAKCEPVKLGRRTVGGIYDTPAGKVYLAYRWIADAYRGTEPDISAAVRAGKAMWAVEADVIGRMRSLGVTVIGVVVRDTGERYLAKLDTWYDHDLVKTVNVRGRSGTFRALPFTAFTRILGKIPRLK